MSCILPYVLIDANKSSLAMARLWQIRTDGQRPADIPSLHPDGKSELTGQSFE
jgi:hypothetical protein